MVIAAAICVVAACGIAVGIFVAMTWRRATLPEPATPKEKPTYTVRVRWMSRDGRVIGETPIDRRLRRSQMYHTRRNGKRGVFAAERVEDGVWVYRHLHDV